MRSPPDSPGTLRRLQRRALGAACLLPLVAGIAAGFSHVLDQVPAVEPLAAAPPTPAEVAAAAAASAAFEARWEREGLTPAPEADAHTLARRLSLALTGAPPSLEELRRLETLPEGADPVAAWLGSIFEDSRYHDYFAERLARAVVGAETGPFLVYRRRRFVSWIAEQLERNRPYDEIVRELVAAKGIWTSNPAANFVTVTIVPEGEEQGPNEAALASRTARAFLGLRLDCMECHDDKFGDHWKQSDFHELAAFFGGTRMGLTGVRDDPGATYAARYLGRAEEEPVAPAPPFARELLPDEGLPRERLAAWVTHRDNAAFSRAAVNRIWALLHGRPLVEPVDDLPLEGPFPPGLEPLAEFFVASDFDLRALVRVVAMAAPFRRDSRFPEARPADEAARAEASWALFPVTPLRSEQMAGNVIQATTLRALDGQRHILHRLRRGAETLDFVRRYGDQGEDEFLEAAGTIPQRLLLMNGKLVSDRIDTKGFLNASTRLARHGLDDRRTVEAAFLATLSRYPDEAERHAFASALAGLKRRQRDLALEDLYWTLLNSTEFAWNR